MEKKVETTIQGVEFRVKQGQIAGNHKNMVGICSKE